MQRQAEGIARLEEGLPNRTPAQVAFHNLLVTRQVRLCDVLGPGPQGLRLVAAGTDWDAAILLAGEGAGGEREGAYGTLEAAAWGGGVRGVEGEGFGGEVGGGARRAARGRRTGGGTNAVETGERAAEAGEGNGGK